MDVKLVITNNGKTLTVPLLEDKETDGFHRYSVPLDEKKQSKTGVKGSVYVPKQALGKAEAAAAITEKLATLDDAQLAKVLKALG